MASITFNRPDKSNIYTNSVTATYSADGWELPENSSSTITTGDTKNGTRTDTSIEYTDLKYSWTFFPGEATRTDASGMITISGLTPGSQETITATLSVSYTEETYKEKWTYTTPSTEGATTTTTHDPKTKTNTKTVTLSSVSSHYTVYTNPGSFEWNFTSDIIQSSDGLTAAKYNNFVTWFGKARSWSTQSSKTYSHSVNSGDVICASDYNFLANEVGVSEVYGDTINTTNDNYGKGTLITKALFETLATEALK